MKFFILLLFSACFGHSDFSDLNEQYPTNALMRFVEVSLQKPIRFKVKDSANVEACERFEYLDSEHFASQSPTLLSSQGKLNSFDDVELRPFVTDGVPTEDYPSVVFLLSHDSESYCTGTFIGSRTLMTAAHCISERRDDGGLRYIPAAFLAELKSTSWPDLYQKRGVTAQKIIFAGESGDSENEYSTDGVVDLAILVFKNHLAPAISPLSERGPRWGERVRIVGFGDTYIEGSKRLSSADRAPLRVEKLTGTNRAIVDRKARCRAIFMRGSGGVKPFIGDSVGRSVIGSGDSGGPVFVGDRLAGVAVAAGLEDQYHGQSQRGREALSYSLDLSAPFLQSFFEFARKQGAEIPRIKKSLDPQL